MIFAVVVASCSDPSTPAGPPASMRLMTTANLTVPAGHVFPVRVLISDASGRAVDNAPVVFQFMRLIGGPPFPVQHVDTVHTDATGEATINAAAGPVSGSYQMIVTVANAQFEPAVVDVNVTPDAIVRFEISPDSAAISVGGSVALGTRAFDRFGNTVSVIASFRSLSPAIVEVASGRGNALALGTGLIVAEHAQFADTARVVVLSHVSAGIALGARHSCELRSNGGVYCWGAVPGAGESNDDCGGSYCLRTPRLVASTLRFEAIAAGGDQTCALSSGALYCWGRGGAVPGGESTTPQRVPGSFPFTSSFTVGRDHACATTDGAAYCWGDNSRGQLGTGNRIAATMPTAVLSTQRFRFLRAGPQFTCGVTLDAAVHCWGANTHGQLGRGTTSESEPVPAAVVVSGSYTGGFTNPSQGAGEHVCVPAAGSIRGTFCWGRNDLGQFGDGTSTSSATPRFLSRSVLGLVTTATGTCAQVDILARCWGSIGGYQYEEYPETMYYRGSGLTAGDQHACAYILTPPGPLLRCWGDNSLGALGDGTLNSSRVPVAVVF
jgi:alpha-tubulin suppressor-like RCC1 family protein